MNGCILINKTNLINNLSQIKRLSPDSKVMSMIKSDAYGHGIIEVAKVLDDSHAFAVATIQEAKYLRNNNITKEIVCLQGFSNASEYLYCSENNIRPVIHDLSQIYIIEETLLENKIKIWIKIDTGMNRLGFHNHDFYEVLNKCKEIEVKLGRNKSVKNSPRTCDIDIIDYNKRKITNGIILPHPRIQSRNFVLLPLFEINKDWIHPISKHSIKRLIFSLPNRDIRSIKQI